MRKWTKVVACSVLWLASPAVAQDDSKLEIGTSLGAAVNFANGESITLFGVPGAGTLGGLASLYVTTFATPRLMVEPQVQLQVVSGDGETASVFTGILQFGFLLLEDSRRSPYVAVHAGGMSFSGDSYSDTVGALGFALGHRWRVGPGGALRVEARFRRWIDEGIDLNEIAFTLGVGGIFR